MEWRLVAKEDLPDREGSLYETPKMPKKICRKRIYNFDQKELLVLPMKICPRNDEKRVVLEIEKQRFRFNETLYWFPNVRNTTETLCKKDGHKTETPPTLSTLGSYKFINHNRKELTGNEKDPNLIVECDRVLSFGKGIRQESYKRGELRLSDHRPVSASVDTTEMALKHSKKTHESMTELGQKDQ
ncbi:hypothetical protein L2E82_31208 [Cichorium intybus]|uniref:Uncharacterized protein n=1 Tax=Cichorium intybus TaxID=13427 RepID=A0ACB9D2N7_CICIN|nr:hypothetical protein L2E82_31208 [Cichorium intybus]